MDFPCDDVLDGVLVPDQDDSIARVPVWRVLGCATPSLGVLGSMAIVD